MERQAGFVLTRHWRDTSVGPEVEFSFATIHQVDFTDPTTRARHKEMICEAVLRYVRA